MGVQDNNSLREAAAQLLTPQGTEQGDVGELEQETLEEETQEVEEQEAPTGDTEETDELEGEETEVGDSDEDDDQLEQEEEPSDEPFYSIKVDGEEFEVNLDELKKGYGLEKNYTKKSQALAEREKEVATLQTELSAQRDQYLQITQELALQRNAVLEKAKAELSSLDREGDPVGYVTKQLEVQEIAQGLADQRASFEAAQTEKQTVNNAQMQQYLVQQDALLQSNLEGWNNPEESKAIKEGLGKFALSQGYSEAEVSNINSARDIIVLNKARLFDEMQSKKAKIKDKRTPKKATPKVRASSPKTKQMKNARATKAKREQFNSSGSVKDAQNLMVDLMQRKPIRKR